MSLSFMRLAVLKNVEKLNLPLRVLRVRKFISSSSGQVDLEDRV